MKSEKLLSDFIWYCQSHPEERFWQALKNWSGYHFIRACEVKYLPVPEPNPLMQSGYSENMYDTFHFEGKRHDEHE